MTFNTGITNQEQGSRWRLGDPKTMGELAPIHLQHDRRHFGWQLVLKPPTWHIFTRKNGVSTYAKKQETIAGCFGFLADMDICFYLIVIIILLRSLLWSLRSLFIVVLFRNLESLLRVCGCKMKLEDPSRTFSLFKE